MGLLGRSIAFAQAKDPAASGYVKLPKLSKDGLDQWVDPADPNDPPIILYRTPAPQPQPEGRE